MDAGEDDGALVARLQAGDRGAFEVVYARYSPRVYGYLLRMVLDRAAAEDLHQETWVRFARGVRELRDGARLAGWLFRIAHNLATSRARRRAVERVATNLWAEQQPLTGSTPHEALEATQQRLRLERALAALAPADRELVLLVGVEGLRPQDAAEALGVGPEALRKRLERARARLRVLLASVPAGDDSGDRGEAVLAGGSVQAGGSDRPGRSVHPGGSVRPRKEASDHE